MNPVLREGCNKKTLKVKEEKIYFLMHNFYKIIMFIITQFGENFKEIIIFCFFKNVWNIKVDQRPRKSALTRDATRLFLGNNSEHILHLNPKFLTYSLSFLRYRMKSIYSLHWGSKNSELFLHPYLKFWTYFLSFLRYPSKSIHFFHFESKFAT